MANWMVFIDKNREEGVIVSFSRSNIFTSLKGICDQYDLPYSSAIKGKRRFEINGKVYLLDEIKIEKIKGRGRKSK